MAVIYAEKASLRAEVASQRADFASERARTTFEKLVNTEEQLREYGLSVADTRTEFKDIFEDHLVGPLRQYQNSGARIHLLLSTPAYGYGVLGADKFSKFVEELGHLHDKCSLEVILFSPDDHFFYWANVLLWSEVRAQESFSETFAEDFAKSLHEAMEVLESRPHCLAAFRLWITRATTVRQFSFFPIGQVETSHTVGRVYVVLTDQFTLSQNQSLENFRARSTRVVTTQQNDYEGPNSHFERVKVCPYTGQMGEDASVGEGQLLKKQLQNLHADYVLGRTRQLVIDLKSFASEVEVFLKTKAVRDVLAKNIDEKMLLLNVLKRTLRYLNTVLPETLIQAKLTEVQASRLVEVLLGCRLWGGQQKELNSLVETLLTFITTRFARAKTIAEGAGPSQTQPDTKEYLIECLYRVLTSGFGESEYASTLIDSSLATGKPVGTARNA